MKYICYIVLFFCCSIVHDSIGQVLYNCENEPPNTFINPNIQITSFDIYNSELDSLHITLSDITSSDNSECFFYTEDTLSFMNDIDFNLQHDLPSGEQVYVKIWVDLNQDGISNEDDVVFVDSTTDTVLSGNFTLPLEFLAINNATCHLLMPIRIGMGTSIEELNASKALLFMMDSPRPKITISSKKNSEPSENYQHQICISTVDSLLFYIGLDYNEENVTFTDASLSIIDQENPTITYDLEDIEIFDHLDSLGNPVYTPCTYNFGTCPPTLLSYQTLIIGVRLTDLPFNPMNTSLTKVSLSLFMESTGVVSSTFYLGCCEDTSKIYNNQNSIIDTNTELPYFFTSTSDYIEVGGNPIEIDSGEEVYLKASNYIVLKPGTNFKIGATGRLFIGDCGSNYFPTIPCNSDLETSLVYDDTSNKAITTKTSSSILLNQKIVLKVMPNPFQNFSTIKYTIPKNGQVGLSIYDVFGKSVKTLINNQTKEKGSYKLDFYGDELPRGIYFLNLEVDTASSFLKIIKS